MRKKLYRMTREGMVGLPIQAVETSFTGNNAFVRQEDASAALVRMAPVGWSFGRTCNLTR